MNGEIASKAQRRTLINALEHLAERANMAEEVSVMSRNLVEKLERTDMFSKDGKQAETLEKSSKVPDLVDLFDQISDRLEVALNKTAKNIDQARSFID